MSPLYSRAPTEGGKFSAYRRILTATGQQKPDHVKVHQVGTMDVDF